VDVNGSGAGFVAAPAHLFFDGHAGGHIVGSGAGFVVAPTTLF
jgi:hypothetical protein